MRAFSCASCSYVSLVCASDCFCFASISLLQSSVPCHPATYAFFAHVSASLDPRRYPVSLGLTFRVRQLQLIIQQ